MKFGIFLLLFYSTHLLGQQPKFRTINEVKINDSVVLQTGELTIFNNTGHTICIRVSTTFAAKVLGRDTIQFGTLHSSKECNWCDLWVCKDDMERGDYDFARYPLVLNNRASFVTMVSLLRNLKCRDFGIKFSYIDQVGIDYNELLIMYEKHQSWDKDPNLKYLTGKVSL
jgi:hypothetical protein